MLSGREGKRVKKTFKVRKRPKREVPPSEKNSLESDRKRLDDN